MLEHTFCHVPGIGAKLERRLWSSGLHSWAAVTESPSLPLSASTAAILKGHVRESVSRLADNDARYFYDRLPSREHWRLFSRFRHHVAYLDIETTGLGNPGDYITTITLYDGHRLRHYVKDANLVDFQDDIRPYRLIVTYNGKTFDLPFIRNYLGLRIDQPHIDLRYVLARLGYRGGLKGCEKQLGLDRGELEGIDGYFAVLLWFDYLNHGNERALETLLAYNMTDVVNLQTLMHLAYNREVEQTPFAGAHRLAIPPPPELPFRPHTPTVEKLRRRLIDRPWG